MAIDSHTKRRSACTPMFPGRGSLPLADGSVAVGDRQHVALLYSGIGASSPVAIPSGTSAGYMIFELVEKKRKGVDIIDARGRG